MGLSMTFLGRCADRWRVRVELAPGFTPRALTVGLWNEAGRPLGPAVVVPLDPSGAHEAELRGPPALPAGSRVVATADDDDGGTHQYVLGLDTRRGLHAFLHADARLRIETDPAGSALSRKEKARLGRHFPWLLDCCTPPEPSEARGGGDDDLLDMLRKEFDVDPDDVSDALLDELRR